MKMGSGHLALSPVTTSLVAGLLSGVIGLLAFLVIHHLWIKPIWSITLPGLLIASVGGLAIGWAHSEIAPLLPPRPISWLLVAGIMILPLLPAVALSFTHGPLFDLATATIPKGQGRSVAIRASLELLVTATAMGALLGWNFGRSLKAAIATALAGLALAIGPGHNETSR
jgi:hypothetical protein